MWEARMRERVYTDKEAKENVYKVFFLDSYLKEFYREVSAKSSEEAVFKATMEDEHARINAPSYNFCNKFVRVELRATISWKKYPSIS
jgi:hypothetical protein